VLNVEHFAITLGRTLELVRAQADKDEQKAALRALVALTKLEAATVTRQGDAIAVGGSAIPQTLPHIAVFTAQLSLHRVGELAIAKDAAPADLLNLLRALAADPSGGVDLAHRMADAKVTTVSVGLVGVTPAAPARPAPPLPPLPPIRRGASVTQAFDQASILAAAGEGPAEPTFTPKVALAPAVPARAPMLDPVARLNADPAGPGLDERLDAVAAMVRKASERGEMVRATSALASVVRREGGLPDGEAKQVYGAAIRQMLTKYLVGQVARMVLDPYVSRDALQVVRWLGVEGRDAVLELLGESTLDERKAYFEAVRELHNGADAVTRMLNHHQLHVVHNVAELLGDLRWEAAVPDLAEALKHYDPKVRRTAAAALARIGTPATVEHLQKVMADEDPEVRAGVASAVVGRESRALTVPILAASDAEENPVVQEENYRALGRIGSPEAVQALIKAAQPGGRLRKKRPVSLRLAAIDGLRLAGGPAAHRALEKLTDDDPEPEVRDAARHAAQEIKRPPASAG
jgi:HEAT repeat protein